jgi:protein involved in polysaccharide export with SLBB domain
VRWTEASPRDDPACVENHVLHESIARLPAKYQAPIVLCYLEGLTHEQAAERLGWPVGTVRGRLARARDRLRARLKCDGAASAGLPAWAGSPVPDGLRTALHNLISVFTASSQLPANCISPVVAGLASTTEGLAPMLGGKLAIFAASAAAVGVVLAGPAVRPQHPSQTQVVEKPSKPASAAPAENQKQGSLNVVYAVADLLPTEVQGEAFVQAVEPLIQLLTSTVAPGTWVGRAEDGRAVGPAEDPTHHGQITLFLMNKSLLIRHDPEVQELIARRLAQLRYLKQSSGETPESRVQQVSELVTATYPIHELTGKRAGPGSPLPNPEPFLSLITSTIAPGTWKHLDSQGRELKLWWIDENGQPTAPRETEAAHVGSLAVSADCAYLRVTHTPYVHTQLKRFLDRLLELNDPRHFHGIEAEAQNAAPQAPDGARPPASERAERIGIEFTSIGELKTSLGGQPVNATASKTHDDRDLPEQAGIDPWDYSKYRVDHPDILRMRIRRTNRDLDLPVSPEGTIQIPEGVGALLVRGETVDGIKVKLLEEFRKRGASDIDLGLVTVTDGRLEKVEPAKSDAIAVEVASFNSKLYSLEGLVRSPGKYPWVKGMNVWTALRRSGGLKGDIDTLGVSIRRAKPESGEFVDFGLTVKTMKEWILGDTAVNIPVLEPGDVVIVFPEMQPERPVRPQNKLTTSPPPESDRLNAQQKRLDALEIKVERMLQLLEESRARLGGDEASSRSVGR